MLCGVRLGILLICLAQAERVCCLWATQDAQKGNAHVAFSPQSSGFGGNFPQDQLGQASGSPDPAQSSSLGSEIGGGASWFRPSGFTQTAPGDGGSASVERAPSRPSAAAGAPPPPGKGALPYMKSSGAASNKVPDRTRTSASVAAKRVSSRGKAAASGPSRFPASQSGRNGNHLSQLSHNPPASGPGAGGAPGQGFAPTDIHIIPEYYGGFAIRRLKAPADQKVESGEKMTLFAPRPPYATPQEPSHRPPPPAHTNPPPYVPPQEPSRKPPPPAHAKPPPYVTPQEPSRKPPPPALAMPPYVPPQQPTHRAPPPSLANPPYVPPQQPTHRAPPPSLAKPPYVPPQQPTHRAPPPSLANPPYVPPQEPSHRAPPPSLANPPYVPPQEPSHRAPPPSLAKPPYVPPQQPTHRAPPPSLANPPYVPPQEPSHRAPPPALAKLPYVPPQQPPQRAPPPPSLVAPKWPPAPPKPSVSTETRWMRVRSDQLL
ncbi:uncharacterized protein LOC119229345 isoform X2 [Pungitius pungitius]|uniref:uncharacterized protein LOC119229345 isoform X2 n=1 Tax=Pungitius pungitius TaxID=134920 RepID=UPI002E142F08